MSESPEQPVAVGRVSSGRGISFIWIAPVVAAIAVGVMLYETMTSRGPMITVTFENAEGVVEHKTPLKYEGVEIGVVDSVEVSAKTGQITLQIRMNADASDFAAAGTQFWIQTPQIGVGGIRALDTLISGPYVACIPGDGDATFEFQGLTQRPPVPNTEPGLRIAVEAQTIGSLHVGSPVLYRGARVGEVDRITIKDATSPVHVSLFIEDDHRELVTRTSYFWEMSGIHASFKLDEGFRIDTKSFQSILDGGVAFHSPAGAGANQPVADGAVFALHSHPDLDVHNSTPVTVEFKDASGIEPGVTVIRHEGVKIGVVTAMDFTDAFEGVRISALLNAAGKRFAVDGTSFWIVRPEIGIGGVRDLDTLINGVHIDCLPGDGSPASSFTGLTGRPGADPVGPGLHITLKGQSAGSLRAGAPVYYREVVVGAIVDVGLAADATHVAVRTRIEPEFAYLVHERTRFWNASGLSIHGGLGGIDVKSESLESILAGGVAFATPNANDMGAPAANGAEFTLHKEPDGDWLQWSPALGSNTESPQADPPVRQAPKRNRSTGGDMDFDS